MKFKTIEEERDYLLKNRKSLIDDYFPIGTKLYIPEDEILLIFTRAIRKAYAEIDMGINHLSLNSFVRRNIRSMCGEECSKKIEALMKKDIDKDLVDKAVYELQNITITPNGDEDKYLYFKEYLFFEKPTAKLMSTLFSNEDLDELSNGLRKEILINSYNKIEELKDILSDDEYFAALKNEVDAEKNEIKERSYFIY